MAQVKITLTRSLIGYPKDQRATVKALGLGKIRTSVVKEDSASSVVCSTRLHILLKSKKSRLKEGLRCICMN